MRILVTGATGFVGSHIIKSLIKEGYDIKACARDEEKVRQFFPDYEFVFCDFMKDTQIDVWLSRLDGVDVVINTVGIIQESSSQTFDNLHAKTPSVLFQACEKANVKQVIQISAAGADETGFTDYHKSKKQADDALRTLGISSVILRPSLLYGEGGASWRFFQALSALPVVPILGDGKAPVQPVHISDVVKAVLRSIQLDRAEKHTIDLVSEHTLPFRGYLEIIRSWQGYDKMRAVHIPYNFSSVFVRMSFLFDDMPLDRDTLHMLEHSRSYDTQKCFEALRFVPTGFETKLKQIPSTPAQRQYSRFYFLEYLLCWSLAAMWVWTGVVSAFLYPTEKSYELLAATGISGSLAPVALYGASLIDFFIGVALVFRYRITFICWLQICLILTYTAILTFSIPEFWFHPFGPLLKNIPILTAILFVLRFQETKNV